MEGLPDVELLITSTCGGVLPRESLHKLRSGERDIEIGGLVRSTPRGLLLSSHLGQLRLQLLLFAAFSGHHSLVIDSTKPRKSAVRELILQHTGAHLGALELQSGRDSAEVLRLVRCHIGSSRGSSARSSSFHERDVMRAQSSLRNAIDTASSRRHNRSFGAQWFASTRMQDFLDL